MALSQVLVTVHFYNYRCITCLRLCRNRQRVYHTKTFLLSSKCFYIKRDTRHVAYLSDEIWGYIQDTSILFLINILNKCGRICFNRWFVCKTAQKSLPAIFNIWPDCNSYGNGDCSTYQPTCMISLYTCFTYTHCTGMIQTTLIQSQTIYMYCTFFSES